MQLGMDSTCYPSLPKSDSSDGSLQPIPFSPNTDRRIQDFLRSSVLPSDLSGRFTPSLPSPTTSEDFSWLPHPPAREECGDLNVPLDFKNFAWFFKPSPPKKIDSCQIDFLEYSRNKCDEAAAHFSKALLKIMKDMVKTDQFAFELLLQRAIIGVACNLPEEDPESFFSENETLASLWLPLYTFDRDLAIRLVIGALACLNKSIAESFVHLIC